jgi:signal recognition particle receptor subunit beta
MSTVNVMAHEIAAKIVFYGPGLSGKTTTLKRVYDSVKPAHRGELMSLPTEADRTLFFDFLPVKVERVNEYSVRLALYTVPGQVFYNATRKLVLQGADGVVFVADSQPAAEDANRESLQNLEENLAEQGIRIEKFPLVIQYNKRDIENVAPLEQMRTMLNPRGCPDFETCATNGQGVLDTLKAIMRLVIKDLRAKKVVPAARSSRPDPVPAAEPKDLNEDLEGQIRQHLDQHPLAEIPPMATPSRGLPAVLAVAERPSLASLGPASAMAPHALIDPARVADAAFAAGDWEACVRACLETVRRGLNFAGEGSAGSQAYLLGLDGRDLLALEALINRSPLRVDDAAFALFVLMQTFIRLRAAGLPHPEH